VDCLDSWRQPVLTRTSNVPIVPSPAARRRGILLSFLTTVLPVTLHWFVIFVAAFLAFNLTDRNAFGQTLVADSIFGRETDARFLPSSTMAPSTRYDGTLERLPLVTEPAVGRDAAAADTTTGNAFQHAVAGSNAQEPWIAEAPKGDQWSDSQPRSADASWMTHRSYIGMFGGMIDGDPLIRGQVDQGTAFFGGVHVGWDFHRNWGLEKRFGYEPLRVVDKTDALAAHHGYALLGDYRLMCYPWGDTRWRPYASGGIGLGEVRFEDDRFSLTRELLFIISYGAGIKYLWSDRFVLRLELADLLALGRGEISTMHNISLTGGFEYRFNVPKRCKFLSPLWQSRRGNEER
jgi:hypothetical protein